MMCPANTAREVYIWVLGNGLSNKLRQIIMCVVNKKGFIWSKKGISMVPIMVNRIITDMLVMMGPIELSVKQESINEKVATTFKLKKAITNAPMKRQSISPSRRITNSSLLSTIKSPCPKIKRPTPKANTPNQRISRKV